MQSIRSDISFAKKNSDIQPTAMIFDIKRYAIHDGLGIRTTVFFKGCPLACLWCSNPESQAYQPELTYIPAQCLGCGLCEQLCPHQAISRTDQGMVVDHSKCNLCGICAENCPGDALQVIGRSVTVDDLFRQVVADRPFWDRSGGGVTLSGGEPLVQFDFVLSFLKLCKERYISTAIETCLNTNWETISTILPFVDHLICDLKIMDSDQHKINTGISNHRIKKNLESLLKSNADVLVRMPLIPGINDNKANLEDMGAFIESCRKGAKVELLPYHRLGEAKYRRMQKKYKMAHVSSPTKTEMDRAIGVLASFDIHVLV